MEKLVEKDIYPASSGNIPHADRKAGWRIAPEIEVLECDLVTIMDP